jgi:hypothetical protein
LIYFVFNDDTYVISSIFACSTIIGELTAGVRFCWKKDRQDVIFRKNGKFPENTQKILFYQKPEEARRGA